MANKNANKFAKNWLTVKNYPFYSALESTSKLLVVKDG